MCSNCLHPNCDITKIKSLPELIALIQGSLTTDDAKKIVFYSSG